MSRLELFLLGPPRIELDKTPVELGRRRALALLIYLAVTGESSSRDALATMFWPDYDQGRARTDLRRTLYVLNETLGRAWLEIDRETISLYPAPNLWLDVAQFHHLISDCARHGHPATEICPVCLSLLSQAVALYRDDFLAGFTLPGSPGFDEWQFFQTESLRQELISALDRLVRGYSEQGEYEAAIPFARRWQALDPLHEAVHRRLMRLYVWTGQQSAALRQYEVCARLLKEELGASPDEETTQLYQAIREKRVSPPKPAELSQPTVISSLPAPGLTAPAKQAAPAGPASPAFPVRQDELATTTQTSSTMGKALISAERASGQGTSTEAGISAKLEPELRIATVLVADVSRSVSLAATLDSENRIALLSRLLQTMSDILVKYEAQVKQFLGEGVLAIFGVSHLHEDDPERAIWAALEIQETLQEFGQQGTMGINTGEVYLSQASFETPLETVVMGPTINLAAQFQQKAEIGQILVGETTYSQTHRAFRFKPVVLSVEMIDEWINAYRVVRPRRRPEKSRGIEGLQTGLIGRDEELAKLKSALNQVSQGQGQIVALIGEAGVGKSRLVAELREAAHLLADNEPGILWLEGRCLEMGRMASYWPFIDIFRDYFAWRPHDNPGKRAKSIISALHQMVRQGRLSAERLNEMGPLLGNLLSVRSEEWDKRLKNAGPEQVRHETFLTIHDFFITLAQQQPVILVFEDIHWADSLSLDLISLLMETLRQASLLLLCVYRPEPQHKSWHLATIASRKCPERFTELRLRELTPQQSRQLVEALLAMDDLPPSVKDLILEKAQGNPLFVEEIVRSLIDSGVIYREADAWRVQADLGTMATPTSVQNLILSRVDRLEAGIKQLLQCAAVIGHLFRRRVLAEIVPSGTDLTEALRALEDYALIYQERIFPEEEYSFKHVLTQATVYQTIPRWRRTELHRRVAEAMELLYQDRLDRYYEQIAYHYDRSDASEKAAAYLLKAGEKARRAYLTEEAIGYFRRVLERPGGQPQEHSSTGSGAAQPAYPAVLDSHGLRFNVWHVEARKGLGQTYFGVGRLKDAEEHFRQAIDLGQKIKLTPRELVRLYFWLGEVLLWQDRFDERIQVGEAGLALLAEDVVVADGVLVDPNGSVEAALMNQTMAAGYNYSGNRAKFRELTHRTAQFIQDLPYSEELRPAYHHIVEAYLLDRDLEAAHSWLQVFEQQAQQHHDVRALGESHFLAGTMLARTGDIQGAIAREQQALDLFTKIGDDKHRSWPLINVGRYLMILGDIQQADSYIHQALEIAEIVGRNRELAQIYEQAGLIYLCQGAVEKAIAEFLKAAKRYQEIISPYRAEILIALGRAYLAQGNQEAALAQFKAAITLAETDGLTLVNALSGLQAVFGEAGDQFRAFCGQHQQTQPEISSSALVQWHLEPTPYDPGFTILDFGWQGDNPKSKIQNLKWHDPFGDCSFATQAGVEIYAANGRDLWHINLSAPRLLRPMEGDFAVQTVCLAVTAERPAIGGVLLWKDEQNYLRLDMGVLGQSEILFSGYLKNQDAVIGRGRLPLDKPTAPVFLRLERLGQRVNALCSVDGQKWFTIGRVEFSARDPVEVGLYAIGNIDRAIYHGAFPEGTAIRFEEFWVWR